LENGSMTAQEFHKFESTSDPLDADSNTGAGSIAAVIISKGGYVSRYTPQGSIKPFGQSTGTADDFTALTQAGAGSANSVDDAIF